MTTPELSRDGDAGAASDAAGNTNTASTSTDNTVTYDATAPPVTINQAVGQADPTNTSPINFTVSSARQSPVLRQRRHPWRHIWRHQDGHVTGSGTTYNVAVSGMTSAGTVTATRERRRGQRCGR
jgi:hypothetical protein